MDILAHSVWAASLAKSANTVSKNKKFINAGWSAFWGVFPDLFAFTLPFSTAVLAFLFGGVSFSQFSHHGPVLESGLLSKILAFTPYLYQISHSLVIFLSVFLLVYLFSKKLPLPMLGWALHILIDIPSHSIGFYPTPFLWPISSYKFPYGTSWADQTFMIINYSALLFVWLFLMFKNRTLKKSI